MVEKDEKKIKMIPFEENGTNKGSKNNYWEKRFLVCLAKEYMKEEKMHKCHFEVIPKGLSVQIPRENIPTEVERMRTKFKGIMVDEMTMGFPPMRSISHKNDLISRSSFINKTPHRMTPTMNVESNRRV